ncbi:hypothetical protein FMIA91_07950 [Fidelibacter multiformis]|jgi:hypothetical protein
MQFLPYIKLYVLYNVQKLWNNSNDTKKPGQRRAFKKNRFLINYFFELQETDSTPEDEEKKPVSDEDAESDNISP